ncbi:hypothetical protein HanIR_Chr01g0020241 [Helianthus annuus]|nr:hypothetical protein HanIR_Chr01g0020241 [Helianthus annuus]
MAYHCWLTTLILVLFYLLCTNLFLVLIYMATRRVFLSLIPRYQIITNATNSKTSISTQTISYII